MRRYRFGQSFQITPIRLAATVSSLINGGTQITPHFGVAIESSDGETVKALEYSNGRKILDRTRFLKLIRYILEQVVAEGSGQQCSSGGISDWRKDCNITDASQKCKSLYFFVSGIRTGK